jgi:Bardet-Biedl syndrome 4 protein
LGSYKASLETYTEAEKISVDWEILHNKGICYVHLKQYNDALDNFTKAIQLSPQIESYKELGRVHLLLGDLHKAADVYRKAKK